MTKQVDDFYDDFLGKVNKLKGNLYRIITGEECHNVCFLSLRGVHTVDDAHIGEFYDLSNGERNILPLSPEHGYPRFRRISHRDLNQEEAENLCYYELNQRQPVVQSSPSCTDQPLRTTIMQGVAGLDDKVSSAQSQPSCKEKLPIDSTLKRVGENFGQDVAEEYRKYQLTHPQADNFTVLREALYSLHKEPIKRAAELSQLAIGAQSSPSCKQPETRGHEDAHYADQDVGIFHPEGH